MNANQQDNRSDQTKRLTWLFSAPGTIGEDDVGGGVLDLFARSNDASCLSQFEAILRRLNRKSRFLLYCRNRVFRSSVLAAIRRGILKPLHI